MCCSRCETGLVVSFLWPKATSLACHREQDGPDNLTGLWMLQVIYRTVGRVSSQPFLMRGHREQCSCFVSLSASKSHCTSRRLYNLWHSRVQLGHATWQWLSYLTESFSFSTRNVLLLTWYKWAEAHSQMSRKPRLQEECNSCHGDASAFRCLVTLAFWSETVTYLSLECWPPASLQFWLNCWRGGEALSSPYRRRVSIVALQGHTGS